MSEELRPSRVVAILPFALAGDTGDARQADLCRGFAVFLERRLGLIPGVRPVVQNFFIAPESHPERKGWLMTTNLWSVEQAAAFPFPEELAPTHLLQGRARWTEEKLDIEVELIDLSAGESMLRESVEGAPADAVREFFGLIGGCVKTLLDSEQAGRIAARMPTLNAPAFQDYIVGLAGMQAYQQSMAPAMPAMESFAEAISAEPGFHEACAALEQLATIYVGKDEAAQKDVSALLSKVAAKAEYPRFGAMIGLIAAARGEDEKAAERLEAYLRTEQSGALASEAFVTLARLYVVQKKIAQARGLLRAALHAAPENAAAWEVLGDAHALAGEEASAEECWRRALQEDPGRVHPHRRLGENYFARKDYRRALGPLTQAWDLCANGVQPGCEDVRRMLIDSLLAHGKWSEANEHATAWVEEEEFSIPAWVRLSEARRRIGDLPAAVHCLRKAREITATQRHLAEIHLRDLALERPAVYDLYWKIAHTANFSTEAAAAASEELEKFPVETRDSPLIWEALRRLFEITENWKSAALAQRKVIAAFHAEPLEWVKYAELKLHCGEVAEAKRILLQATEKFPTEEVLAKMLSWLQERSPIPIPPPYEMAESPAEEKKSFWRRLWDRMR
ncbi:hypothetical protein BH09SUM1_BH09SUM1_28550 [soil metagenome]